MANEDDLLDALTQQLEELKLISYSLLPDERFTFISPDPDENATWADLLNDVRSPSDVFSTPTSQERTGTGTVGPESLSPLCWRLKVDGSKAWFDVTLPSRYNGTDVSDARLTAMITVQGENISRNEHELWNGIVRDVLVEIGATEYPLYQLFVQHLVPLLHEEASKTQAQPPPTTQREGKKREIKPFHALLVSHHLISPTKRRHLQQWSSSLSVTGFAKVGYPGVIYGQGDEEDITEFVENIKAMTWLALRVRFVEPLPSGKEVPKERQWLELQKVGEVVAEMKRLEREEFVLEMGIGSAGAK
ncbi:hypothetical protein BDV98DRAFT_570751 [Pterulicium gracile]|uniref:Uncharacterized protein n=1 Tax=Pterulicium gracile TaxID=1884261 RepID=A0A5C3QGW3_9AGAR|nr:hypothetical protein BDV98DRAFT_570751 [Pterula gracilis]